MSGHSKWSTIKHKKAATDAARGKLFSKLVKAIAVAAKTGGSPDPDFNPRLRAAVDEARDANMPKENIERAIKAAGEKQANLEEVVYEGYGPGGFGVIVEVASDNRNRTGQEIKGIFEHSGGNLAGPGSVAYNFVPRGLVLVKKEKNSQEQMLALIDLGVEEIEEDADEFEIWVAPEKLSEIREKVKQAGFVVASSEQVRKPLNLVKVTDPARAMAFLEKLDDHDDVQKVFANVDLP